MNFKTTTLIAISILLGFALLANLNVGSVFATGNLDDEEEEAAIEKLEGAVQELKGTLGTLTLNLEQGSNDIQANCPSTEEIVQEVIENITTTTSPATPPPPPPPPQNNNVTQSVVEEEEPAAECPTTPPPPPAAEEELPECKPVQSEPPTTTTEQNETLYSDLEPIICPINGAILGYTNTTTGEQLPVSAVNETIPFLPPIIELPPPPIIITQEPEEEQQQQLPPVAAAAAAECNNVTQVEEPATTTTTEQNIPVLPSSPESSPILQDEQEIATIEFEASCGCFVVDKTPNNEEEEEGIVGIEESLYNQQQNNNN